MARFDRYMLSQLLVLFGFFALVLVSVYWINSAVQLFDTLIGEGQSAWIFAEFTALTLPNVIRLVLPVAGFAASVYVTNRLSSESELTVMQATGFSPWRLARPVLVFGLIVAAMMSALTHFLVPASLGQLVERQAEIARNVTSKLLTEGTFLHPSNGVTFYIREISPDSTLNDVFLSDRRRPGESTSYTAETAFVVRDGEAAKLVMVDGLSQTYNRRTGRLFITHFADFTYDISALIDTGKVNVFNESYLPTPMLLADPAGVAERAGNTVGTVTEELHGRFAQALVGIAYALVGFAALLVGEFSRFGVWRQIVGAILILTLIKLLEGVVADPVRANAESWPLMYLPALIAFAVAAGLLAWAGRSHRVPGHKAAPPLTAAGVGR
ncbi:LPS export ABC transporter permease LptF [Marimonas arenosa]|uniref:LPS export ABC transporter permease LptF n=1 Tax=Marimonas arenosa TaxID=1795305 RepID=A0AAE4B6E4_9RHOB|nr:LPS export ABC transporter permease LptF [Marimonas arenosa]MDQ2091264.1 LPS export ABC transporter permease LptF [Marimonas arenosa]